MSIRLTLISITLFFLIGCSNKLSPTPKSLPEPQAGHSITHDKKGNKYLFGGFAGENILGKVWRSSNSNWEVVDEKTPFANRTWYTATPFLDNQETVIFGGKTMSREPFNETWLWKNGTWQKFEGINPPARSHHTSVYDPARKVIVLFGGDNNKTLLNDIWEWDGNSWKEIAVKSGPSIRAAHMSAYDPIRKLVVVAGGVTPDNQTRFQDVWGWDGKQWHRLPDLPNPLALAAAASDTKGMVVFGGWSKGFKPVANTLRLTDKGWSTITNNSPIPSAGATLTLDKAKDTLILSGGMDSAFKPLGNIWLLKNETWQSKE